MKVNTCIFLTVYKQNTFDSQMIIIIDNIQIPIQEVHPRTRIRRSRTLSAVA